MPAVHVRDVPEETLAVLRQRARRHGHSMQQELRLLLARAAAEPEPPRHLPPIESQLVMATQSEQRSTDHVWTREEMYGDDGR